LLGNDGSWAKFLGEKLDLELINLGKGGSGNDSINWRTIEFSETNKEIAKNSIYVIQLSECLRYHIYFDNGIDKPQEWQVTPICFLKGMEWNKGGNGVQSWIYKNKEELIYIYGNITFALYKTLQNIISLTSYFESNGYPYIIFDGINDHNPIKVNNSYYLKESWNDSLNEQFKILTSLDIQFPNDYRKSLVHRDYGYFINEDMIQNIFSNKKIFKEISTMMKFVMEIGEKNYNDSEYYFKENNGHPNQESASMWADIIKDYIEKIYK
jgi:hypothetical protein